MSEGCKFCYAERETKRYGLDVWGPSATRIRTTPTYWKQPLKWNKRAESSGVRERVFCASWADVGEDHPDWVQPRRDLVQLIKATPALDWLLLTKRPENLVRLFRDAGWYGSWPKNVWAGCTVENQAAVDERIPHLLKVPASIRFLSCEPMLEPANIKLLEGLQWVIIGGESGPHARPFDLSWARDIRDQCKSAKVSFFFKQAGSKPLDGGVPLKIRDPKGGNLLEIPEDLRIQEWPRLYS